MTWYCKTKSYWYYYLVLVLVAMMVVREAVKYQPQRPSSESLQHQHDSVHRQERKHDGERSGGSTSRDSEDRHQTQKQASGVIVEKKSHKTARPKKKLFKSRPYTTPPTPYAVLPDFQTVAKSPTEPSIPFHFPHPNYTRSTQEILAGPWVARLHRKLNSLPVQNSKQVSIVFSDSSYADSLLNWLIASQVRLESPIENFIVVCLDKNVFSLLDSRDIPSILVDKAKVLKPNAKFQHDYSSVWIVRMIVYRLINYFGYDVVSYDTDAIPLRNLQPVFDDYQDHDIVGSAGIYPFGLGRIWGFTMCMGVIRFRSTTKMEMMWELMSSMHMKQAFADDQTRLNYALRRCGIQWQDLPDVPRLYIKTSPVSGQCSRPPYHKIQITVLPDSFICRKCTDTTKYYVAHPQSKKDGREKMRKAKGLKLWFLAEDWQRLGSGLVGRHWLAALSGEHSAYKTVESRRTTVL